jgi:hypothetical protein
MGLPDFWKQVSQCVPSRFPDNIADEKKVHTTQLNQPMRRGKFKTFGLPDCALIESEQQEAREGRAPASP